MTSAAHHVALRVTDIERSTRFYQEALDAQVLTRPFTLTGEMAEALYGGHPGLEARICLLSFEEGGGLELFEFVTPARPARDVDPTGDNIVHWGFQVESVRDAMARVEAHGGRTHF